MNVNEYRVHKFLSVCGYANKFMAETMKIAAQKGIQENERETKGVKIHQP